MPTAAELLTSVIKARRYGVVTFNTPVIAQFNLTDAGFTLAMTSVVSGQPILLYRTGTTNSGMSTPSDNFSTPYNWTQVIAFGWTSADTYTEIWIGTGGVGTSGTITVVAPSGLNAGCAVSCIGASTAAGLAAIQMSGHNFIASSSAGQPFGSPDTPSPLHPTVPGCGALVVARANEPITTSPSSPWAVSPITYTGDGNTYASLATMSSPTVGADLTTSIWEVSVPNGVGEDSVGCLVLPKVS